MSLERLLAARFLGYALNEQAVSSMIKICFFSIALATFALTLVTAIMQGLEKETRKKLQGVNADLYIDAEHRSIDYQKVKAVLAAEFPSVVASSPTTYFHALLSSSKHDSSATALCIVKIIDPLTESTVTTFHKTITSYKGTEKNWHGLSAHSIALGQALAQRMGVTRGDSLTLYYPEEQAVNQDLNLLSYKVTVGTLYKTGIQELDEQMIIGSFELLKALYRPSVGQILLKVASGSPIKDLIESLHKRLSLKVYSWEQLYTPLLAALELEKYAMFFIVGLIAVVASSTIIALLFMYATQKRTQIAVLTALGMSSKALMRLYIYISLLITLSATGVGIFFAWVATILLQRFPFIRLPDAYYVTYLPAELSPLIVAAVGIVACIMGISAALIPLKAVRSIAVAHILKGLPS